MNNEEISSRVKTRSVQRPIGNRCIDINMSVEGDLINI